jgi:hypothetical protein
MPRDNEAMRTESSSAAKWRVHPENEDEHSESQNEQRETVDGKNAHGDQDDDKGCIWKAHDMC